MIARKSITVALALCLALPLAAQTTYRWVDRDGKINYSDQPPPPEVKKAEEKQLGAPNSIASGGPDYATRAAAQSSPVILYGSGDCAAGCKAARDFLNENRIPYSEKTIKTPDDAAAFKKATGSEEMLVPTLLVGTVAQKGFEDGAWRKLLDAAGYPIGAAKATTQ